MGDTKGFFGGKDFFWGEFHVVVYFFNSHTKAFNAAIYTEKLTKETFNYPVLRKKQTRHTEYQQQITLGIQSPSENGNGTERPCFSEVIIHPNHHLTK